jgi:hypothetical protein
LGEGIDASEAVQFLVSLGQLAIEFGLVDGDGQLVGHLLQHIGFLGLPGPSLAGVDGQDPPKGVVAALVIAANRSDHGRLHLKGA